MVSINTRWRNKIFSLSRTKRGFMFLRMGVSRSTPCCRSHVPKSLERYPLSPISLPKRRLRQFGHWAAIIDVGGSESTGEDVALVVDHQMELEAIKPAHRSEEHTSELQSHSFISYAV